MLMDLASVLSQPEIELLANKAQCVLANNSFWDYCNAVDPEFYREDWEHLVTLTNTLENFYYRKLISPDGSPYTKLMVNMPPQHGKTRTLVHFCEWALGRDNWERIITASYNDSTASDFSRYVRDGIQKMKIDDNVITFSDVFPDTKIKKGHAGFEKWALSGQHFNYLGAGIGGSITSKGGTILMVDDPIKGAIEAMSATYLKKCWEWYSGTFISRVSAAKGQPLEIIVMTRWSTDDLCGKLLKDPEEKDKWYILLMEAYNEETGEMLCPELFSYERYKNVMRLMPRPIFRANYHQQPLEFEGALYSEFKTYEKIPKDDSGNSLFESIESYTDTADEGKDWLCTIIYGVYQGYGYVLDVYYTKEKMEITEPALTKKLIDHQTGYNIFESNNGGKGFARNVDRIAWENYAKRLSVYWFHQSKNKKARIFSNSATAQEVIMFPVGWENRWPEFYLDLMSYMKEGDNDHDDAPDALTGVVERIQDQPTAGTFDNTL